jgi:DNA-binding NtrC family response regulator
VADAGFAPRAAETAEKARSELARGNFDLALADPAVLGETGHELFDESSDPSGPVTGVWSSSGNGNPKHALRPGLTRLGRLVGRSMPMQRVYDQLIRVAPTEATVFLNGETGTGKELVAETVHRLSPRKDGLFLPINCGAIPASLIESELFGHEKGCFTGADRRRRGYFEEASGGTLFLDEITEMPIALQVKLLRVLETGVVTRIGARSAVPVDVRVITSSNRDPQKAVKDGALREDLLYRLNVFPIQLPRLRERGSDIEMLAQFFIDRVNIREGVSKHLSDAAVGRLAEYDWPGNVRELKNVVERAAILTQTTIGPGTLLTPHRSREAISGESMVQVRVGSSIEEVERDLILATLQELGGDKKGAAEVLGISLKTLYTRLKLYKAQEKA